MIPDDLANALRQEKTIQLALKVVPKASRDEISGVMEDGSLKVKVTAPPDKGKANAAVCDLLSAAFGVPKHNVEILRGHTSTSKIVRIIA